MCLIQRYLNKETEQIKSTWSINRGSRGTCVGVTGQTYVGVSEQHSCPDERARITPVTYLNTER